MAELADALDSGSSGLTALEVRVLFRAPLVRYFEFSRRVRNGSRNSLLRWRWVKRVLAGWFRHALRTWNIQVDDYQFLSATHDYGFNRFVLLCV
jgi:hypothetical protein